MAGSEEDFWGEVSMDKPTTGSSGRSPSPPPSPHGARSSRGPSTLHSSRSSIDSRSYRSDSFLSDSGDDRSPSLRRARSHDRSPSLRRARSHDRSPSLRRARSHDRSPSLRRARSHDPAQPPSLDTGKGSSLRSSLRPRSTSTPAKSPPHPLLRGKGLRGKSLRTQRKDGGLGQAGPGRVPRGRRRAVGAGGRAEVGESGGLAEARREVAALRAVLRRQEGELSRLRAQDSRGGEAERMREELRVQREALRLGRSQRDHLQRLLRQRNDALQKSLVRVRGLEAQLDPAARPPPSKAKAKLQRLRRELEDKDELLGALEAKLEAAERRFRQQMAGEAQRQREAEERLLLADARRRNVGKISRTKRQRSDARLPRAASLLSDQSPNAEQKPNLHPGPETSEHSLPEPEADPPLPSPSYSPEKGLPEAEAEAEPAADESQPQPQDSPPPAQPTAPAPAEEAPDRKPTPVAVPADAEESGGAEGGDAAVSGSSATLPGGGQAAANAALLDSLLGGRPQPGPLDMPWEPKSTPSKNHSRHGYRVAGHSSPETPAPKAQARPTAVPPLDMDELFGPRKAATLSASLPKAPRTRQGHHGLTNSAGQPKPASLTDDLFGPKPRSQPTFPWDKD